MARQFVPFVSDSTKDSKRPASNAIESLKEMKKNRWTPGKNLNFNVPSNQGPVNSMLETKKIYFAKKMEYAGTQEAREAEKFVIEKVKLVADKNLAVANANSQVFEMRKRHKEQFPSASRRYINM